MSAAPVPRLARRPRPRAIHAGKTEAKVIAGLRISKWAPTAPVPTRLLPDLFRLCSGAAQCGVLASIAHHTFAEPHDTSLGAKWKPQTFTPPMVPEDFAKELGFSREQCSEAIDDLVRRGVVEQLDGADSVNRYRYRLAASKWPKMASAKQGLGFARKPIKSEGIDEETEENEGEQDANTRATTLALVRRELPSGRKVKLKAGERFGLVKAQPREIEYHPETSGVELVAEARDGVLHLSAIAAAAAPAPKAGGKGVEADIMRVVEARGYTIDRRFARAIALELGAAPVEYFGRVLDENLERARAKRKPLAAALFPTIAKDAADRWPAIEARKKAADDVRRSNEEEHIALWREIVADPNVSQEDRDAAERLLREHGESV